MEERYLSLAEACEVLGKSERTLYRWIKAGKLKAYKPGRDYEIPVSAIREMRERSEVYPKVQAPLWDEEPQRRTAGVEVGETYFVPLEEGEEEDTVTLRIYYAQLFEGGEPILQAMREASPEEAAEAAKMRQQREKSGRVRE